MTTIAAPPPGRHDLRPSARSVSLRLAVLIALWSFAGLVVVLAAPASATPATTIVSKNGLPNGWEWFEEQADGHAGDSSYAHVEGPAGVPSGLGSLRVTRGPRTAEIRLATFVELTPGADFRTLSMTYRSSVAVRVKIGILAHNLSDTPTVYLPPTSSWSNVNILAQTMTLVGPPHGQSDGQTTWTQLLTDNPDLSVTGFVVAPTEAGTAYVDTISYTTTPSVTTVDFDTDPIPMIISSTATIVANRVGATVLSGRVHRPDGTPIVGLPIALWSKTWGTGRWVMDQTVNTGSRGVFGALTSPAKQTYYQWRVAANGFAAAVSGVREVDVAATVTMRVHAARVAAGTPVIVAGRVSPHLAGIRMTLRDAGPGRRALKFTTTRSAGVYTISRMLPEGVYRIYVSGGSDLRSSGLVDGASPSVVVHVGAA